MSGDTSQPDGVPDPGSEAADLAILRSVVARLSEHFETVQVFATRHVDDDTGTVAVKWGSGNWFARRGQVAEWLVKEDAQSARE